MKGKDGNIKKEEEEKSDKGNKEARKEEEEDRREESGKAKNETDSKENRRQKNKPKFVVASATYMPYFCFSTYYPNDASLCEKQTKFKDMKTAYEDLKGAQSPVIHESPTLDEWYYQFATDDESQKDRRRRNKSQVVTKAIEWNKSTKDSDKTPKKSDEEGKGNEAENFKLVRVNQLWAWTIANSTLYPLLVILVLSA
ncbi:hypothetical protein NW755_001867 [Fusarium falciforme]|uniref:Uncharacterized protein n=1 Tax=Fusarium falciforme TaxID=195108 RepID=A0A9W8RF62_9HYPO|nr:hypothetical protein NW755_001867 [Fusarium falciforme]